MAIGVYFNNKKVVIPGAYSTITSGESNAPRALDYGTVMIIDTGVEYAGGSGIDSGGGSGINGENAKGKDAIYQFSNIDDFRNFIKCGKWWKLAEPLFKPDPTNAAAIGVSNIIYVKNATTKSSTLTIKGTGGTPGDGSIVVKTVDEGAWTVGKVTATGNVLYQGYAYDVIAGVIDSSKYIVRFWRGNWKGNAKDGLAYDEISQENSVPVLVCQSKEITTGAELVAWMKSSSAFNSLFILGDGQTGNDVTFGGESKNYISANGTGGSATAIDTSSDQLATGGTTTYLTNLNTKIGASQDGPSLLDCIKTTRNSFVITDVIETGEELGAVNKSVLSHINNDASFKKSLFVASKNGVEGAADLTSSCTLAQSIDDCHACVVFGGMATATNGLAVGYRWWDADYTMCAILGRTAGKEPQIPVTNKTIDLVKLRYQMSDTNKEQALGAGVLCLIYNEFLQRYVVLQGINTLQDNETLFNNKGGSFSIQFMRIVDQINKELVVNAEIDLLGDENGVNANTLSSGLLKNWTESYLQARTASEGADNLLLSFRNVTVNRQEDYYLVTYGIVVNNEVNKIFFTGFVFRS